MEGLVYALELLAAIVVASFGFSFFVVDVLMNPKLSCWKNGHRKFYYAGNSDPKWWQEGLTADGRKQVQREHVYWCGRCGFESSDEADDRKRNQKVEERKLLYEHTIWEGVMRRGYW